MPNNELARTAGLGQQAVVNLVLAENEYEVEEFNRFLTTVGALNSRFEAIRESDSSVAKAAVEYWDGCVDGIAEALGLERVIVLEDEEEEPEEPVPALAEVAPITAGEMEKYMVDFEEGKSYPVLAAPGRYYLIPEDRFSAEPSAHGEE